MPVCYVGIIQFPPKNVSVVKPSVRSHEGREVFPMLLCAFCFSFCAVADAQCLSLKVTCSISGVLARYVQEQGRCQVARVIPEGVFHFPDIKVGEVLLLRKH